MRGALALPTLATAFGVAPGLPPEMEKGPEERAAEGSPGACELDGGPPPIASRKRAERLRESSSDSRTRDRPLDEAPFLPTGTSLGSAGVLAKASGDEALTASLLSAASRSI